MLPGTAYRDSTPSTGLWHLPRCRDGSCPRRRSDRVAVVGFRRVTAASQRLSYHRRAMRQTIVRNRPILAATAKGFARGALRRRAEFRHHVMREAWTVAKRFAADSVENIEFREIPCLGDAVVEGYLEDQQRLVLAALVRGLGCRTCFAIGTNPSRAILRTRFASSVPPERSPGTTTPPGPACTSTFSRSLPRRTARSITYLEPGWRLQPPGLRAAPSAK